jgi:uncharacterized protein YegP (UPF0339 family)
MYEYFCDDIGEWRWRLKASNGRIISDSGEGYATKGNVKRAIRRHRYLAVFASVKAV